MSGKEMQIPITSRTGRLPAYETDGAAGMDLMAALEEPVVIPPGRRALIPTGLSIALPRGYEAQIRARSGLAARHGIGLVNGIGTIDCDYRGEISVVLINWGEEAFTVQDGDRIAQMVIASYERISWKPALALEETQRGTGGFGSTGV